MHPTGLVVNGKVNYVSGGLIVLQNNYVKIGDLSTSAIFQVDNNNVPTNTRITYTDGNFDSNPRIELSTNQTTTSITGDPQIDFIGAFSQFESISDCLGSQDTNVTWNTDEFNADKLWVDLIQDQTNIINLTADQFNGLNEIKFNSIVPSTTSPFIINITDVSDNPDIVTIDSWPNIVGNPLNYASYMLYNFPNVASTIDYTGGAQIYGTIYAPRARFNNRSNFNIDGQIITEVFEQKAGEIHSNTFNTTVDCSSSSSEEICDGIDNDGDGQVDEGFPDTDGDGVADCIDNCLTISNSDQTDSNGNGIGDPCEPTKSNLEDNITLEAYPVPFNGIVNLKYSTTFDTNATIEIFDIRGILLKHINNTVSKKSENNVIRVDLTGTENQILFVRFTTSKGVIVKQIFSYKN